MIRPFFAFIATKQKARTEQIENRALSMVSVRSWRILTALYFVR